MISKCRDQTTKWWKTQMDNVALKLQRWYAICVTPTLRPFTGMRPILMDGFHLVMVMARK